MKILITGGAGFLGTNLAEHMLKKGHKVMIYDNLSRPGSEINLKMLKTKYPQLEIFRRELDDIIEFLTTVDLDIIYHFAAQVAVTTSYQSPSSDFRINALGTFNLARHSKAPVIYASTNKVYGDNVNSIPIEEHEKRYDFSGEYRKRGIGETFSIDANKHTPYGVSKLVGELYVREFGGVANRFSCMYGENQFGNIDQGWLSHFIFTKLKNEPITIFGDGKQVRDILHAQDVVRLLELEAQNIKKIKGEVFSIGGGYNNTISLLELTEMLGMKPKFSDWRPADQKVFYADISKAKKLLGWQPKVTKEEGIERLENWIKENNLHQCKI
ncbi:MAG: GDP-mannose 4,6-dehydratase [archaeon]